MFPLRSVFRGTPFLMLLGWLLALLVPAQIAHAQPPPAAWVARYDNGTGTYSRPNAMVVDANGNVYITGSTGNSNATIKYDTTGRQVWIAKSIVKGQGFLSSALAVDGQGNVYVTGSVYITSNSQGSTTSNFDYATVKYDTNGNLIWGATYNGTGNGDDNARAVAVDAQSNVYVTGQSAGINPGAYTYSNKRNDYATVKYDSNGTQQWVARYNSTTLDSRAIAIAVDSQGNASVTGSSGYDASGNASAQQAIATIKYDTNGTQLWEARYSGPASRSNGGPSVAALALDTQGNVYITGSLSGDAGYDALTIKYDTSGNQVWLARFHSVLLYSLSSVSSASAITVDAQGNVYITGYTDQSLPIYAPSNYLTVKYDSDGNQLWASRYNGTGFGTDYAVALALDAQGNVYVTGTSNVSGSNIYQPTDYATVRYDNNGNQIWAVRYHSKGGSVATAIGVDTLGNIYVTGADNGASSGDIVTIKYNPVSPVLPDITSQVSVTRSGLRYVRATHLYVQTVTVRNTGGSSFFGPLILALDNLSAGVTLTGSAGLTTSQSPFYSPYLISAMTGIGNDDSMFDPGESVTFTLTFSDPLGASITYTPRVLAGVSTQ